MAVAVYLVTEALDLAQLVLMDVLVDVHFALLLVEMDAKALVQDLALEHAEQAALDAEAAAPTVAMEVVTAHAQALA